MTTSPPEAGRSTDAVPGSAPSPRSEALAALQLWQTFEYLSPQNPPDPKVEKDTCVWAPDPHAQGDRAMPWAAPDNWKTPGIAWPWFFSVDRRAPPMRWRTASSESIWHAAGSRTT
ncbi:MAG: hypothetical protein QM674_06820 [Burkholderiaceae bacterium]